LCWLLTNTFVLKSRIEALKQKENYRGQHK